MGYAFEKLMQNGAKDVTFTPIFGKKMRPSYQINVLCDESTRETLTKLLFLHTTTIGVRYCTMQRSVMQRQTRFVETPYGRAAVKHCVYADIVRDYVEYESAKQLAEQHNAPLFEVAQAVLQAAKGNEG